MPSQYNSPSDVHEESLLLFLSHCLFIKRLVRSHKRSFINAWFRLRYKCWVSDVQRSLIVTREQINTFLPLTVTWLVMRLELA